MDRTDLRRRGPGRPGRERHPLPRNDRPQHPPRPPGSPRVGTEAAPPAPAPPAAGPPGAEMATAQHADQHPSDPFGRGSNPRARNHAGDPTNARRGNVLDPFSPENIVEPTNS